MTQQILQIPRDVGCLMEAGSSSAAFQSLAAEVQLLHSCHTPDETAALRSRQVVPISKDRWVNFVKTDWM